MVPSYIFALYSNNQDPIWVCLNIGIPQRVGFLCVSPLNQPKTTEAPPRTCNPVFIPVASHGWHARSLHSPRSDPLRLQERKRCLVNRRLVAGGLNVKHWKVRFCHFHKVPDLSWVFRTYLQRSNAPLSCPDGSGATSFFSGKQLTLLPLTWPLTQGPSKRKLICQVHFYIMVPCLWEEGHVWEPLGNPLRKSGTGHIASSVFEMSILGRKLSKTDFRNHPVRFNWREGRRSCFQAVI